VSSKGFLEFLAFSSIKLNTHMIFSMVSKEPFVLISIDFNNFIEFLTFSLEFSLLGELRNNVLSSLFAEIVGFLKTFSLNFMFFQEKSKKKFKYFQKN